MDFVGFTPPWQSLHGPACGYMHEIPISWLADVAIDNRVLEKEATSYSYLYLVCVPTLLFWFALCHM